MHGRPRQRPGQVHVETAEQKAKVALVRSLWNELEENHRSRRYTKEALEQNARLVELNPEVYTAWNFRKLAVKHLMEQEEEEAGRKELADEELRVVQRALLRNYKSYGAWHHRKWVISLGLSELDHEFALLSKLQNLDDRNFLGWDYRRFAVRMKGVPLEEELAFTKVMIGKNFSNYSAWHNRSALLSKLFEQNAQQDWKRQRILEEEYKLVNNAFYTEPNDQSAWFYQSWLLAQTVASTGSMVSGHGDEALQSGGSGKSKWEQLVIPTEIGTLRDLLSLETDSKWAKLTLARFLTAEDTSVAGNFAHPHGKHSNEVMELYKELAIIDPAHAAFYWDQHSLLQVHEKISELGNIDEKAKSGWYQLDHLSLTRFAGAERLLFVQKLDLSHNKLRSIDGIESLQVLSSLNISHNLIPSVTALAPLRSIHGLRALDISYNAIGGHSVDPCRYLCHSRLANNSKGRDSPTYAGGAGLWEVEAVFGGMLLLELNTTGNPAAKAADFKQSLLQALPELQVLDGEKV